MNSGEVAALHWATGQPTRLIWEEGIIRELESLPRALAEKVWLAPPLFDLQVNGFGGVDFQRDDLSTADLSRGVHALRLEGCGRFLFTLITTEWPRLIERLARAVALRAESEDLQAAIAGWHIEGPFLSAKPGFHGAHDPALMLAPTPEKIRALRALTGNDPLLLTIAPERPGASEAIALAVSLGVKVSLGHTDASAQTIHAAVQAGATGFTHLGNGCPRELDRHDNILWRVLDASGLTVSLIPDGIHVSAELFRLIHRLMPAENIVYVSDAMAAAGAAPGRYTLGALEVEVGPDQIVRQPGQTNFAGSALRPIDGISRAAAMLDVPWPQLWRRMSDLPARFMGLSHELAVGRPATFCLLTENTGQPAPDVRFFERGCECLPV
ncbi:MAG TPA: N-acetylglucosamine-6-phosphate deacetylase [Verrucomicrobiae bacterium]|nr:N-acetylglucosamine-6-phosphate deacetylase [Verrucomicrobiae bacterium]